MSGRIRATLRSEYWVNKTIDMGFLSNILSATVKTALTPVAVLKDVANVATGEEACATKKLLQSAVNDLEDATDDLGESNLL